MDKKVIEISLQPKKENWIMNFLEVMANLSGNLQLTDYFNYMIAGLWLIICLWISCLGSDFGLWFLIKRDK
jgi:hypothetical protein